MNTLSGTLVPTSHQMLAALDGLREEMGATPAKDGRLKDALEEWDLMDGGPRISFLPMQHHWQCWTVWVRAKCPAWTEFGGVQLEDDRAMSLASMDDREAVRTYLHGIHRRWKIIDSIPPIPVGLPAVLEPMVGRADELFHWQEETGLYTLRIGEVARTLLAVATGQPVPGTVTSHEVEVALSALSGISGPAMTILMELPNLTAARAAKRAAPFASLHKQLSLLMLQGVTGPEACVPPHELATQVRNALIATAADTGEERR